MGTPVSGCSLLVLVLVLALGLEQRAEACTCLQRHTQQHFCESSVVFRATLLSEEVDDPSSYESNYLYNFTVSQIFKGAEKMSGVDLIASPTSDGICGVRLTLDKEYLLTGYIESGKIFVIMCGIVVHWADIAESIKMNFIRGRYAAACRDCNVVTCDMYQCPPATDKQCQWTHQDDDFYYSPDQTLDVTICKKRSDGYCGWNDGPRTTTPGWTDEPETKKPKKTLHI